MSKDINTYNAVLVDPATTLPNRYTADAAERMAQLRLMAAQFPAETDARPLTRSEKAIVSKTSVKAIEKAAVFAESAPHLGKGIIDIDDARDAVAYELAYSGCRDEARSLFRRIDRAIDRRKLKPAIAARDMYRVGQALARSDANIQTHVADMKRELTSPRRKKTVPPAVEVVVTSPKTYMHHPRVRRREPPHSPRADV
jgi:hypothetical protein